MIKPFILSIFIFCGSLNIANSQNFTVEPTNTLVETITEMDIYNIYQINQIMNEDVQSLQLTWKLIEYTFPEEWTVNLCDFGACYFTIPAASDMDLITDKNFGYLKLDINANNIAGHGIARFIVYEDGQFDDAEEVIFDITAGIVSNNNISINSIEVYPNPSTDFINIENPNLILDSYTLVSTTGQIIITNNQLTVSSILINTNELHPGFYFLQLRTKEQEILTKKIQVIH